VYDRAILNHRRGDIGCLDSGSGGIVAIVGKHVLAPFERNKIETGPSGFIYADQGSVDTISLPKSNEAAPERVVSHPGEEAGGPAKPGNADSEVGGVTTPGLHNRNILGHGSSLWWIETHQRFTKRKHINHHQPPKVDIFQLPVRYHVNWLTSIKNFFYLW
jgi:hypothetical protein